MQKQKKRELRVLTPLEDFQEDTREVRQNLASNEEAILSTIDKTDWENVNGKEDSKSKGAVLDAPKT